MFLKKSMNTIKCNRKITFLISFLLFTSRVSPMTLMNSCKTDSDCPPAWDKNAIFCSTPIYSQNLELENEDDEDDEYDLYKRDDLDDIIVYDGSQVVKIDENKPETLSSSHYNKVCISYRPLGYPCKVRSDCLANDEVDLPYIQCVNSTCTDLGKTTGNYMKNARGNHKKRSKYWYIGLGLGIIAAVIILGCISLILYGKKKKNEELKMEEKIKKANENDICDDEDEDNGTVTCVGDNVYDYNSYNKRDDHDEGGTVVNSEINYLSNKHLEMENVKYNEAKIKKQNKKTKRSILNILSLGLLGRRSTSIINEEDNNGNSDTLGHPKTKNMMKNYKIDEVDLTDGFKKKYSLNEKGEINISYDIKREKSGYSSIRKHGSSIDPERTLVRNLHKKASKATVGSMLSRASTKNNGDEIASVSTKNYPEVSELSSVASTLFDNNTIKNKIYDTSSTINGNFDDNYDDDDYVSINVNNDSNDNQYNSENYLDQENEINKAILKRLANQSEQLDQLNNNIRIYKPARSLSRRKSNKHPLANNITENFLGNDSELSLECANKSINNISYPTPKQNPNNIVEMNNNQRVISNTPLSNSESHIKNNDDSNNDNSSSYQGYSSIYDYYQERSDDKNTDKELSYILPQIPHIPISEIVESTFGSNSSDNSSVECQVDIEPDEEIKNNTVNGYTSNKYSIPTPYDSPREKIQQSKIKDSNNTATGDSNK